MDKKVSSMSNPTRIAPNPNCQQSPSVHPAASTMSRMAESEASPYVSRLAHVTRKSDAFMLRDAPQAQISRN